MQSIFSWLQFTSQNMFITKSSFSLWHTHQQKNGWKEKKKRKENSLSSMWAGVYTWSYLLRAAQLGVASYALLSDQD